MTTEVVKISSSGKASIVKDPDATLDYPFDWTDWLDLVNDNIKAQPDGAAFSFSGGLTLASLARDGTRGTGKNWKTDAAGYAIGATAITVSGGSGTILGTDIVRFAGDSRPYPVANFSGGVLTLASPGLAQAIPAAATAVTVRAIVTPMIAGGQAGKVATATCHIQTTGGRIEDRTLYLTIKDR